MNSSYSILANFYDSTIGVDYGEWADYLLSLMSNFHHVPKDILDLGCGTGNLSLFFARKGYNLLGIDLSPQMIELALAKIKDEDMPIDFLVQDIRDLNLSGKQFDTVISTCDVLNYILTYNELSAVFEGVHKVLKPGGLWLFDLNSTKKLKQIYGDESYADLQTDFAYFWDNSYDRENKVVSMELTFFVQTTEGLYERVVEEHRQKLWFPDDVDQIAENSGFSLRGSYDFLTTGPCNPRGERWQFVLEKRK